MPKAGDRFRRRPARGRDADRRRVGYEPRPGPGERRGATVRPPWYADQHRHRQSSVLRSSGHPSRLARQALASRGERGLGTGGLPVSDRVLVTGGAGFVGANVCIALAERRPEWSVVALDNLRRRGSELNLPRLRAAGVEFIHGDVREEADLEAVGPLRAVVECSAEPSVLAEREGGADYVLHANLLGAWHCIKLAAERDADLVFLSTSRVYPIHALRSLALQGSEERFELAEEQPLEGASSAGISERFPLDGARTLYGATKLAAELLITEYRESHGLRAVIDRCG